MGIKKELMVLRVRLHQQSLYLDGQHTLAFYTKCVPPVGVVVLVCRAPCYFTLVIMLNLPVATVVSTCNRRCWPQSGKCVLNLMFEHEPALADRIAHPWMLPGPCHRRLIKMLTQADICTNTYLARTAEWVIGQLDLTIALVHWVSISRYDV